MYYRIVNGQVPEYMSAILPPLVSDNNHYYLRRPFERERMERDIQPFSTSFIVSTTTIWNNLPQNFQNCDSISQIKRFLVRDDNSVPNFFYFGERKAQVVHCKLRYERSKPSYGKPTLVK